MKNGYKLFWTDRALLDLQNVIDYLSENWTQRELKKFSKRLERRLEVISTNPALFPKTIRRRDVRRSVLSKHTVIYYSTTESIVTILTLFDSRQSLKKLRL